MRSKNILTTFLLLLLAVAAPAIFIGWTKKDPGPLAADIRQAIIKSIPLLQNSGHKFIARNKNHCSSCHNNILTALVEEKSRLKGIEVADSFRTERRFYTALNLRSVCDINNPDNFIAAKFIIPYTLIGLKADNYPPDSHTDIVVDYMIGQQRPDGSFHAEAGRPPHETGEAHLAALAIRAIQLYASLVKKDRVHQQVSLTRQWLDSYKPNTQQELAFQLLGLQWCDASMEEKEKVAAQLRNLQHADGSWSQLASMPRGDAYATGEALYALCESGISKPQDEIVQKGIAWLLKTQDASGAWIVGTRAYPIQAFFNCDFPPYDENQFISSAGTNWALLALLQGLPDAPTTASPPANSPTTAFYPNPPKGAMRTPLK
jgi:hypothetical protein